MDTPRRQRWTWAAAVLTLAIAAVVVMLGDRPHVAVLDAEAAVPPSMLGAKGSEPPLTAGGADRLLAFRQRLAAFAPLQVGLRRAPFGQLPATPPRRASIASARVRPAADDRGCLSQAIYYEARGESAEGQAAVAQVVLNRARSGAHPASLCGVVFEGARRPGCQFSFACDPRLAGRRLDAGAWSRAQAAAAAALEAPGRPELRNALNYHADYVRPGWAQRLRRAAEIGRHIFYGAAAPSPTPSSATLAE